jgi:hypothetical protein
MLRKQAIEASITDRMGVIEPLVRPNQAQYPLSDDRINR